MTHNQWSEEVAAERQKIRETSKTLLQFSRPSNYKQQALRELALRLNQDDEIEELKRKIGAYQDLLDGVTAEDIGRSNGMDKEYNENLFNIIKN